MKTKTFLTRGGDSFVFTDQIAFSGEGSLISAIDIQNVKAEVNRLDERICGDILNQILDLKTLEENWDSYGSSQISEIAINNACAFMLMITQNETFPRSPKIMPEPAGGVLLKWIDLDNREFLSWFTHDNNISYLICDGEQREEKKVTSLEELLKIFCVWSKHGHRRDT